MAGYGIIHQEIFHSSLAKNCEARWVFQDLVILADEEDNVMMDDENLSYTIRAPLERVRQSLEFLMAPDPFSKGKLDEGRRIQPIVNEASGKTVGYHIVNRHHYKRLMSRKRRREYMRRYRAKQQEDSWQKKKLGVVQSQLPATKSTQ